MKYRSKITILASVAVVFVIGVLSLICIWNQRQVFFDWISHVDREYVEKMESIKIGMKEEEVIELLGPPHRIVNDPGYGYIINDPVVGEKSIVNRNKVLIYFHGIDIMGHYFIDADGIIWYADFTGGT